MFKYLVPWHPKECLLNVLEAKFMPLFQFCLASVQVVFYEVSGAFFKVKNKRSLYILCMCDSSNSGIFAQCLLPHWCKQYQLTASLQFTNFLIYFFLVLTCSVNIQVSHTFCVCVFFLVRSFFLDPAAISAITLYLPVLLRVAVPHQIWGLRPNCALKNFGNSTMYWKG